MSDPAPFQNPTVRLAMQLRVKDGAGEMVVQALEAGHTIRFSLTPANSPVSIREVHLTPAEALMLADMLHRVRRRVIRRQEAAR